jgi:N-acetylglutamate synthase-like GNAT family acetyltransferase
MIIIKKPVSREDFKAYYAVRFRVLREPFGQAKGTEKDDFEPISQHFMAIDDQTGEIVGCVKLFEKESGVGQFSHMAVLESRQHQGVGHVLIDAVEKVAGEKGYKTLGAMSRLTSTKFFEKFGYRVKGLPAHYFGTTQVVWMEKSLG